MTREGGSLLDLYQDFFLLRLRFLFLFLFYFPSHAGDFSSHFSLLPFCSIAKTVAHLLILRLTFYIPPHSSLYFM